MESLLKKAISQFSLIEKGDTVTIALSGGADSVSLLYILNSLKEELGITINAAHFNHSIRGDEAMRDQNFAKNICEKLGVEFFTETADVPKYARENHLSLELAARKLRYEFLQRVAIGKVATAHTASDNLETVIFNLTRGTSLKGLCGIPPKRDRFIRPLILCTRQDIEKYCELNNLDFVTDSTNLCDDYSRNNIRHNIIPLLKSINPNVEDAVSRMTTSLREDNDYIETSANAILYSLYDDNGLFVENFDKIPVSIAKRIIIRFFGICYPEISLENRHINEIYDICCVNKGKINLPSNLFAVVKNSHLNFEDNTNFFKTEYSIKFEKMENVNNLFSNNILDCDKIVGKLTVRNRLDGDKFRPYKRGCTKTLKSLFTESKIPQEIRNTLPVVADEKGIVWVYNIGVADRCAVTKNTKNIINIKITEKISGEV